MELIEKCCSFCGKSFKQKQRTQLYCSKKCQNSFNCKKRRLRNLRYRVMQNTTCVTCKSIFIPKRITAKYCKPNCSPSKRARKRLEKRKGTVKQKPKWCSWKEVEAFYTTRPSLNHELDHIIPLNHPNVSGLHIPANFQWLTKEENNKKSNKFDGTLDNESWREELKNS